MMELARKVGAGPTPLKRIAKTHGLSEHYLEQLVSSLRNAGLVKSVRGAHGGYVLARAPKDITAGDILRVLEGPISPVEFEEEEDPAKRRLWLKICDSITEVLDSTTLEDLIQYKEDRAEEYYMFYI